MTSQERKKVANIYLNKETHATLKALAAHQEMSIQAVAAYWLEEIQPNMNEMVIAFDKIKSGKDMNMVLQNLMARGLQMAGDELMTNDEEQTDATDKRKGD